MLEHINFFDNIFHLDVHYLYMLVQYFEPQGRRFINLHYYYYYYQRSSLSLCDYYEAVSINCPTGFPSTTKQAP